MSELKVGQIWIDNSIYKRKIHILALLRDMRGKNKVVIQKEYPAKPHVRPVFESAQVVTPSYLFGQTLIINEKGQSNGTE